MWGMDIWWEYCLFFIPMSSILLIFINPILNLIENYKSKKMGVIENREDGTSIDHSQYGDYHFDEKGNLTTFRPVSKLNHLIQQIGIQKVIEMVGFDIVDEFGKYKIINLDLGGDRRYYLRMVNPSTKEIHYEGVPNDCNSVEKAIKWRNQSNELPEDLT